YRTHVNQENIPSHVVDAIINMLSCKEKGCQISFGILVVPNIVKFYSTTKNNGCHCTPLDSNRQ
ncbi:hypothetical protein, partial [Piscirickettsia salmonis]